jgi:uncharacterized protein
LPMYGLMFPGPHGVRWCFVGHAEQVGRPTAQVSVAAELRLFLKPAHRTGPVLVDCDGVSSLGHVVQSLGIPLTEVSRLTVHGRPVPPRHRPGGGDVVDVGAVDRPQPVPVHRFLLDVHLGALARRLRLAGIDAAYANDACDGALIEQANADRRILLSQDRGLLRRRALWLGGYVYGAHPDDQFTDVLGRFTPPLAPWTRSPKPRQNRCFSPAHGAPTRHSHDAAAAARCTGAAHMPNGSRHSSPPRNAPSTPSPPSPANNRTRQMRAFSTQRGLDKYAGQARNPVVEILTVGTLTT